MKKWFKECPFCANEIREWAIKCQYCKEFLTIKDNIENHVIYDNNEKDISSWKSNKKRNLILWIIVFVFLLILWWLGYEMIVQHYAEEMLDNMDDYSSVYSTLSDLDMLDSEEGKYLLEVSETMEKYQKKRNEIWELYITELNDYKNLEVINNCIDNWKLYKKHTEDFINEVENIIKKAPFPLDDEELTPIISSMADLDKFADENIKFLSYMKTIQDEFYVSEEWQMIFNNEDVYEEYSRIANDFYNHAKVYNEKYNNL